MNQHDEPRAAQAAGADDPVDAIKLRLYALMAEVEPDVKAIARRIIEREQGSRPAEAAGPDHPDDREEPRVLDPNDPFDAIKLRLDALMAEAEADAEAVARYITEGEQGSEQEKGIQDGQGRRGA